MTYDYEAIRGPPRKRAISPDGPSSSPLQQPIIMPSAGQSQDPDKYSNQPGTYDAFTKGPGARDCTDRLTLYLKTGELPPDG
jgi:hypothetical protein